MVVAIPLIYWGLGILLAGGATISYKKYSDAEDEQRRGRIDLPDFLKGRKADPEPEPELKPNNKRPGNAELRMALEALVQTEKKIRDECDDSEEQECPFCKPAVEGSRIQHSFQAGTVRKPTPKARGSLYQHYILPWFGFEADETDGMLRVKIEEWVWRRPPEASWDGMDHAQCLLYEVKLGYRDFIDESLVGTGDAYAYPNPAKPFLGSLERKILAQTQEQYSVVSPEMPKVRLLWVFSDHEVMWQFAFMCRDKGMVEIEYKHAPYHLAPDGTLFVGELYRSGEQDYGYWEDG